MDQNILEAIQKSLPAMQMDALKKELEKASHYDKLMSQLSECQKENQTIRIERDTLKKLETDMKIKVEECIKIKNEFQLAAVNHELKVEKEKFTAIKDLMYAAFRNPEIHKSYQVPVQNMGFTQSVNEMTQRT